MQTDSVEKSIFSKKLTWPLFKILLSQHQKINRPHPGSTITNFKQSEPEATNIALGINKYTVREVKKTLLIDTQYN